MKVSIRKILGWIIITLIFVGILAAFHIFNQIPILPLLLIFLSSLVLTAIIAFAVKLTI